MMNGTWTPRRRTSFAGIKGLTGEAVIPHLPTIGRLRKGDSEEITTKSGKKAKRPIDLDHFRFTASREGADGERLLAAFHAAYGDAPRALDVYLPYPEPTENFQTCMEEWVAGGLVHRCDGETMTLWQGPDGQYHEDARPCPYYGHPELRTPGDKAKNIPPHPGCREVGRLNVLLPALVQAGYVGTVTLVTTSINDIIAIAAALQAVAEEQQRNMDRADLRGILFTLRRVPEMISTPGAAGKRVRRAKWLVVIEPAVAWVQMQLQMARQAALPQLPEPAWQPQPPDWEDVTSNGRPVAEVEAEFTELPTAPGFAEAEDEETAGKPGAATPGNGHTAAADWLDKHAKIISACRQAHNYLSPQQIAERLSTLGVDPAAGPDVAIDALNRPVEQPGLFPAEVA
jgi:hypothetical protein